ncbi:MAG: hypothetical protein ABR915_24270 [Thermoguttaceae bacterium]|jgi:hypothetical protein
MMMLAEILVGGSFIILAFWAWRRIDAVSEYRMAVLDACHERALKDISSGTFNWLSRWDRYEALPSFDRMMLSPRKWPMARLKQMALVERAGSADSGQ